MTASPGRHAAELLPRLLVIAAAFLAACSCDDHAPTPRTRVQLNLDACFDDTKAGPQGECRITPVEGEPAGCLLAAITPELDERLLMVWAKDGLALPGGKQLSLRVDTAELTLFLGRFDTCGSFPASVSCPDLPGCLHQLGPITPRLTRGAANVLDFVHDGECEATPGRTDSPTHPEPCDGLDNDCDGVTDEPIPGECTVGVGDCMKTGDMQVCADGARVCGQDGQPLEPGPPGVDDTCNGRDEDCDDASDEELSCDGCADAGDCPTAEHPVCVEGVCRGCDPGVPSTCPDEQICDSDDFVCRPCIDDDDCDDDDVCIPGVGCRPCIIDDDCDDGDFCIPGVGCRPCRPGDAMRCPEPDSPICDPTADYTCQPCREDGPACPDGTYCHDGRCSECTPDAAPGQDGACPAGSGEPICREGECRPCADDCPNDLICLPDGRCVFCDPDPSAASTCPPERPICDPSGLRCVQCDAANLCDPDLYCVTGECRRCNPDEKAPEVANGAGRGQPRPDLGCSDDMPVCDENDACQPCQAESEADDCDGGQCVRGNCKLCDPADNAGCDPGGETPRCTDDFRCAPCTQGSCGADLRCAPDGRCVACLDNDDCGGQTPICDTGTCRACNDHDECAPGYCAEGACVECLGDPAHPCAPGRGRPICSPDRTCVGCTLSGECAALGGEANICHDGDCVLCSSPSNAGCDPLGTTPRCDEQVACIGCNGDDAFCRALPLGRGPYCTASGRCAACDPDGNRGCGGVTPLCNPASRICERCQPGRCPSGDCSPSGACIPCDPARRQTCALDSFEQPAPPVCDPETRRCQDCASDEDCDEHALGPYCVEGRCACDPDGTYCDLASDSPTCDAEQCRRCREDGDCGANPYGLRCDPGTGVCIP